MAFTGVTNKGKNVITDRLQGGGTYPLSPRFMGYGSSSGATAASNNLVKQIGGKAGSGVGTGSGLTQDSVVTSVTPGVTNDTYQVIGTLTASGTWGITEAALFTSLYSGTGDMFAYSDFGLVTLNANDSIQFTWQVTFT